MIETLRFYSLFVERPLKRTKVGFVPADKFTVGEPKLCPIKTKNQILTSVLDAT